MYRQVLCKTQLNRQIIYELSVSQNVVFCHVHLICGNAENENRSILSGKVRRWTENSDDQLRQALAPQNVARAAGCVPGARYPVN